MRRLPIILIVFVAAVLSACQPQKEVDLEIPPHERLLTVECFLEPGKPYRLVLTESVGFFDGPDTPFVDNALVVISHAGVHDTLVNGFTLDFQDFKVYNYASSAIVPADFDNTFSLYVRDPLGRELNGTTRMMRPVEINRIVASFNADSMASATAHWQDIPGEKNYYHFTMHLDSLVVGEDSDNGLQFDFNLDDRIGDGEEFTVGTFNDFTKGQSIICTVYHMTEEYWRYRETVDLSVGANGNPFANPVTIFSTVQGGFGTFTGLNYHRDTLLIE